MNRAITKKMSVMMVLRVNAVLLVLLLGVFFLLMHQQRKGLERQLLEKERLYSQIGARAVGKIIDEAIDSGRFQASDFFDPEYVPIPGTTPQLYHTKYDTYFDTAIQGLQSEFAKDASVLLAAAVDLNGYMPTSNSGDKGGLAKQIVNDKEGLMAAQGQEVGLVQVIEDAKGGEQWAISSPISVKGKHWGAFRIGAMPAQLGSAMAAFQASLLRTLFSVLIVFVVATLVVTKQALKPLARLTQQAATLADGNIDTPISGQGIGEFGSLAESLERLRVSMKVAMERLYR